MTAPEAAERPHAPTPAGLLDDALCHQAPALVTRVVDALDPTDVIALVKAIERAERVRLNRATGVDIDGLTAEAFARLRQATAERFGTPSRLD